LIPIQIGWVLTWLVIERVFTPDTERQPHASSLALRLHTPARSAGLVMREQWRCVATHMHRLHDMIRENWQ